MHILYFENNSNYEIRLFECSEIRFFAIVTQNTFIAEHTELIKRSQSMPASIRSKYDKERTKTKWSTPFLYQFSMQRVGVLIVLVRHSVSFWYDQELWVALWQNEQNECAPSDDSGQPGNPPSLIKVFAVRMKKPWVLGYPLSAQRRLWSDWAGWSESSLGAHSFCWFCHEVAVIWIACQNIRLSR